MRKASQIVEKQKPSSTTQSSVVLSLSSKWKNNPCEVERNVSTTKMKKNSEHSNSFFTDPIISLFSLRPQRKWN